MQRFIQLHMLTAYPPANLNRDDLGRPKTALVGGAERLRISSQSLKRAWRTSEPFQSRLSGHIGLRTKRIGERIAQRLIQGGISEKKAREWARIIAGQFGKLQKSKDDGSPEALYIEQLTHFSPEEIAAIDNLADRLIQTGQAPEKEDLELLTKHRQATDIALFGRMLADRPAYNVEAACQVAHAITTHRVVVEDDFYTAVDDLNTGQEDAGAGHMGETEFGSGLFYLYICLDRQLLLENLDNDHQLAATTIEALIHSAATVAPTGKQNSFASRARANYILCEKGDVQPRSLAVAFLKPVSGDNLLHDSIRALEQTRAQLDQAYGDGDSHAVTLNTLTGTGTLNDIIEYAAGDMKHG